MKLLFLDIETTGLDPEKAELIELSAVRVSPDFSENREIFDELVAPENSEIPIFVQNLTGISPELLRKKGKKLDEARADFAKFVRSDDIICGHNIGFDTGFLRHHGFDLPEKSLDTFPLANILLPDEKSFALEVLTKKYEIAHKNAHRALADVLANIELLKILFEKAREISPELSQKFQKVFEKSEWTGKFFFEKAFSKPKKSKKGNPQISLFDAEISKNENSPDAEIVAEILDFARQNQFSAIQIPPEKNPKISAIAAARKTQNVAVVCENVAEIPADFFPFARPENLFCPRAFEKFLAGKSKISDAETIAALKILAAIERGATGILADLPLFWAEKEIAKKWTSADHSRCDEKCPAWKIAQNAATKSHFACRLEDAKFCPAEKLLVLDAANLAEKIDRISRENFSTKNLEKALLTFEKSDPKFVDDAFFGLGLLKNFIRKIVGESAFSAHFLADETFFAQKEIQNLRAGFAVAAKKIPDFQKLADFLAPPPENWRLQITIFRDENLFFSRAPIDLKKIFDDFFAEKTAVVFLDSRFFKKGGRFFFGSGIPAPPAQKTFKSDFFGKIFFAVPTFGGNTKFDGTQKTADFLANILPKIDKNLLIFFPSAKLLDDFFGLFEKTAAENHFKMIIASGSAGKIAAQMTAGDEKKIMLTTAANLKKIDFSAGNFAGILQHRLFFEPPADPIFRLRNADADGFLDLSLPRAIFHFLKIADGFLATKKNFFWICLDAHFQKSENFTTEFLAHLPPLFSVFRGKLSEISAALFDFLKK